MDIETAKKAQREQLPVILIHPLLGEIEYKRIEKIGKFTMNSRSGKVIYRLHLIDKVRGKTIADMNNVELKGNT